MLDSREGTWILTTQIYVYCYIQNHSHAAWTTWTSFLSLFRVLQLPLKQFIRCFYKTPDSAARYASGGFAISKFSIPKVYITSLNCTQVVSHSRWENPEKKYNSLLESKKEAMSVVGACTLIMKDPGFLRGHWSISNECWREGNPGGGILTDVLLFFLDLCVLAIHGIYIYFLSILWSLVSAY